MRQIYKYNLTEPITGHIEKFLHLDYQFGEPMVWAIVNDDVPMRSFAAICSGTGWPIADFQNIDSYIGTLQDDGGYVWHYFIVPTYIVDSMGKSYDGTPLMTAEAEIEEEEDEDNDFEFNMEEARLLHEKFMQNFFRSSRL